jgi:hypothetical protein
MSQDWRLGTMSHWNEELNSFVLNEGNEDSLEHLQEKILEEIKKGKKMNDQISSDMAEAHKLIPPVDPTAPVNSQLIVQTEADVGAETPETRVN